MDKMMKECMTPHTMTHTLLGIGLGIVMVAMVPSFNSFWLGVIVAVVAVLLDKMRK